MNAITSYHEAFEALKNVYLEDSYVLSITEEKDLVSFEMEFVLTEQHPLYSSPKANEQYCYKKGAMNLDLCSPAKLKRSKARPSTDANGEKDFGNIDVFEKSLETLFLQGCWGSLEVKCDKITMVFDNQEFSL